VSIKVTLWLCLFIIITAQKRQAIEKYIYFLLGTATAISNRIIRTIKNNKKTIKIITINNKKEKRFTLTKMGGVRQHFCKAPSTEAYQ
jgi:hypothetical protein